MIPRIYYSIISTFIILNINLHAANKALLLIDKSFYVTGESIHYSMYLPNVTSENIPIKITFLSNNLDIIESYYFKIGISGIADGKITVPFDLPSGWYHVTLNNYNSQTRKDQLLLKATFPVYNDLETVSEVNNTPLENSKATSSPIQIILDTKTFKPRELIKPEILFNNFNPTEGRSLMSVRVYDKKSVSNADGLTNTFYGEDLSTTAYGNSFGYQFSIASPNIKSPGQREYLSLYLKNESTFRYLSSTTNVFTLVIDPFDQSRQIQTIYNSKFSEKPIPISYPISLKNESVPMTPQIKEYIELSKIRKKTRSLFQVADTATKRQRSTSLKKKSELGLKADRSIDAEKYTEFADMTEFFRELTTPLRFKVDKVKGMIAKIYNPELSVELDGEPVFMINSVLTNRSDIIAKIQMRYIKKVDIYYNTRSLLNYFGLIGQNGLVVIETKNEFTLPEEITNFEYALKGFMQSSKFLPIDISQGTTSFTPIFAPIVYWKPFQIVESNKILLQFYHSDDATEYIIEVMYYDTLKNEVFIQKLPYIVSHSVR